MTRLVDGLSRLSVSERTSHRAESCVFRCRFIRCDRRERQGQRDEGEGRSPSGEEKEGKRIREWAREGEC